MIGIAPACSHGVLISPPAFHEFMMKRGLNAPLCVQRTRSSGSGTGPAKPPTSCPMLNMPDRLIVSPIRMFQRSVCHDVVLSPDHVCA